MEKESQEEVELKEHGKSRIVDLEGKGQFEPRVEKLFCSLS